MKKKSGARASGDRTQKSRRPLAKLLRASSAGLSVAVAGLAAMRANASGNSYTYSDISSGGNWSTSGNWMPNGIPGVGDTANFHTDIDTPFTLNYDANIGGTGLTLLDIDPYGKGNLTLSQTSTATLMTGAMEVIGDSQDLSAFAIYSQSAGTNNAASLYVGYQSGANGIYSFSGGNLGVSSLFSVGSGSSTVGIFNQSAGNLVVSGTATIGASGNGTFSQSNGAAAFNGGLIIAGSGGTATVNLTGGTLSTTTLTLNTGGQFNLATGATNILTYTTLNQTGGTMRVTGNTEYVPASGTYNQSGGAHVGTLDLVLGYNAGSTATYNLTGGSMSFNGNYIGENGSGVFNQTGGTNNVNYLFAAFNGGSSGTYTLSAGALNASHLWLYNGGVFNYSGGTLKSSVGVSQSGGRFSATGSASLIVDSVNGVATYTLNGGTLTTSQSLYIGDGGTGIFNQTNGTYIQTNSEFTDVGFGTSSAGTYNLQGGSASTYDLELGLFGATGTLSQTAGVLTTTMLNAGAIGSSSGYGLGTINLSSGTITTGSTQLGNSNGYGGGLLNVSGGSFVASNGIQAFYNYGGSNSAINLSGNGIITTPSVALNDWSMLTFKSGTLNLTSGISSNYGSLTLGVSGATGTATLNQTGGTVYASTALNLAAGSSSTAIYNLSGANSSLAVGSGDETIGQYGTGIFNQSGGSNLASEGVALGANSGASGTYNLSNGASLTLSSTTSLQVGAAGQGIFNQTGGSVSGYTLYLGQSGGSGTYNLGNGTLLMYGEEIGFGGPALFNMTGGTNTLQDRLFMDYPNAIYKQSGGQASVGGTFNVDSSSGGAAATISGGTLTADGIDLANSGNSFNINGGTVTSNLGAIQISGGAFNFISGTLKGTSGITQDGGTFSATGSASLIVDSVDGISSYQLEGGALTSTQYEYVGYNTGTGTFNQYGGTHTTTALGIGWNGGNGTYTIQESGQLNVTTSEFNIGRAGLGTFNQYDGTANLVDFYLGATPSGTGVVNLNYGALMTLTGTSYIGGYFGGAGGVGLLNITGGTLNGGTSSITIYGTSSGTAHSGIYMTGGGLTAGALTNGGIYNQSGGTATLGPVTGNGSLTITGYGAAMTATALSQSTVTVSNNATLNIGTASVFGSGPKGSVVISGGLLTPVNISGTLSITNGGKVYLNPSKPGSGQTNNIGTLSIGANSALDIGNHSVIVQNLPDETVINSYIRNGYNNQFFNGTSTNGGAINSVVATNDSTGLTAIGYGNSNDFSFPGSQSPYAATNGGTLTGNQVIIKPALVGDLLLRGTVGPVELGLLLDSYGTTSYDGSHINTWAYGNIDYSADGLVGPGDLGLLLNSYGHSSSSFVSPAARAAALKMSVHVNSMSAAPAIANNSIELDVNVVTGDVSINGNNATNVSQLVIDSNGSGLVGNTTFSNAFNALFPASGVNSNASINPFNSFTNGSLVNGVTDIGDIYNVSANTEDLTFQFQEKFARSSLVNGTIVYVGVPEPTTLSIMGVGVAGLLARRRRKSN